jgi:hypothetical protein
LEQDLESVLVREPNFESAMDWAARPDWVKVAQQVVEPEWTAILVLGRRSGLESVL